MEFRGLARMPRSTAPLGPSDPQLLPNRTGCARESRRIITMSSHRAMAGSPLSAIPGGHDVARDGRQYEVELVVRRDASWYPIVLYVYLGTAIAYIAWRTAVVNWHVWYGPLIF